MYKHEWWTTSSRVQNVPARNAAVYSVFIQEGFFFPERSQPHRSISTGSQTQATTMRGSLTPSSHMPKASALRSSNRAAAGLPRAAAETAPSSDNSASSSTKNGQPPTPRVNLIPQSKWADGVPPVMGGHLMASGSVSPLSTSKEPGREDDAFMFYYPAPHADRVCVMQYINAAAAAQGLADMLAEASAEAIQARGAFTIALSGGSLISALKPLASRKGVDFSKWHVFFVDERNVASHDSPDSNYGAARDMFLERAGVPTAQVYALKPGMSVEDAAIEYAGRLLGLDASILPRTDDDLPVLDTVLLGVGPDGHVASLFPNRSQVLSNTFVLLPVLLCDIVPFALGCVFSTHTPIRWATRVVGGCCQWPTAQSHPPSASPCHCRPSTLHRGCSL